MIQNEGKYVAKDKTRERVMSPITETIGRVEGGTRRKE
jgi:hypothetical protein